MRKKIGFYCAIALVLSVFGSAQTVTLGNAERADNALRIYTGNLNVGDARYIGMGGSVGALGAGVSAAEQNPASIGLNINSEISLTPTLTTREFDSNFGSGNTSDLTNFNLGQVGGVIAIDTGSNKWNRVVLGLNLLTENVDREIIQGSNENITYERPVDFDDNGDVILDFVDFEGHSSFYDGYRQKFNLSLATSYEDKIYLGAGLNFHYAEFENISSLTEVDSQNILYRSIFNDHPVFELGSSGFSFNLGAVGRFDMFRLGAAYHSPVWWNEIEEEFVRAIDNGFIDADGFETLFSFYDLNTSGRFVGSGGLIIGKNAALNVDYTYHMNDINFRPNSAFPTENQFLDNFLTNSHEIRLGGELRFDNLKLRGGYNYVQSPLDNVSIEHAFSNSPSTNLTTTTVNNLFQGDINRFSLGLGYDFGGFYIDAAFQRQNQEFTQVFGGGDYIETVDRFFYDLDPFIDEIDFTQNQYILTLGWKF